MQWGYALRILRIWGIKQLVILNIHIITLNVIPSWIAKWLHNLKVDDH